MELDWLLAPPLPAAVPRQRVLYLRLREAILSGRLPADARLPASRSLAATLGSLFFSEVSDFIPCRLCWLQRIAMYPLVVILLVGAIRRDRGAVYYALPFPIIGLIIGGYHKYIEIHPEAESAGCKIGAPCATKWIEEFGFVPEFTTREAAEQFAAWIRTRRYHEGGEAYLDRELLDYVGLGARAGHRATQLSGGEMQRVAIARALANRPALILADEPTGELDAATGRGILDLFRRLALDGTTLVVVTHDERLAAEAGRVVHMLDGRISADTVR